MRTHQIKLPALLAMPFKPVRLWLIDLRITASQRNAEVMEWQRQQISAEIRQEHMRQVQLKAKQMQLARQ